MSGLKLDHPGHVRADLSMSKSTYRIATNTDLDGSNPYTRLFYNGLRPYAIECSDVKFQATSAWLRNHGASIDAIHFHWPESLWASGGGSLRGIANLPGGWRARRLIFGIGSRFKASRFARILEKMRADGKRVIWTVHNLQPHEGATAADKFGYAALGDCADLIICHGARACDEFRTLYRSRGTIVDMAHGNYAGVYPPARPRNDVVTGVGLRPDVPIVGCLGVLRAYKGLDVACEAVQRLGGKVQLMIAGNPFRFDVEPLRQSMASLPGSALIARTISDQEFSDLAGACDILLLPYKRITGSGALLAMLTLGRSVVASDLPFFREILDADPGAGSLVTAGDPEALASAIEKRLLIPAEVRNQAASVVAARYDWTEVVRPVVSVINTWRDGAHRGVPAQSQRSST